eukprot:6207971-Pleurochrysis_carterae.AAC.2
MASCQVAIWWLPVATPSAHYILALRLRRSTLLRIAVAEAATKVGAIQQAHRRNVLAVPSVLPTSDIHAVSTPTIVCFPIGTLPALFFSRHRQTRKCHRRFCRLTHHVEVCTQIEVSWTQMPSTANLLPWS